MIAQPLVSIIIPHFNNYHIIKDCLVEIINDKTPETWVKKLF